MLQVLTEVCYTVPASWALDRFAHAMMIMIVTKQYDSAPDWSSNCNFSMETMIVKLSLNSGSAGQAAHTVAINLISPQTFSFWL